LESRSPSLAQSLGSSCADQQLTLSQEHANNLHQFLVFIRGEFGFTIYITGFADVQQGDGATLGKTNAPLNLGFHD
jgi:hypothetical protein